MESITQTGTRNDSLGEIFGSDTMLKFLIDSSAPSLSPGVIGPNTHVRDLNQETCLLVGVVLRFLYIGHPLFSFSL